MRAGLLGPVEHGDAGARSRAAPRAAPAAGNGRYSRTCSDADPLAARDERGHGLADRLPARAHHDDDALGLGVARCSRRGGSARPVRSASLRHRVLRRRPGTRGVERVHRLARLEVDVRVLRGAADERPLRRQRPAAVRADELLGHERAQVVVGEQLDRVQLVRGAEAVEEVHERHPRRAAWRPARRARGRAPPAPTPRRAARSRSGGPPSRRSGRRRSTAPARRATGRRRGTRSSVSSPAILYMFGIISSRPCEAVNVVASAPPCSAPCSAPAAPPSLCISTTVGTVPQTFGRRAGSTTRRPARPSATTA